MGADSPKVGQNLQERYQVYRNTQPTILNIDESKRSLLVSEAHGGQTLTISTADFEVARHLSVKVNAPVDEVRRAF